MTKHEARRIEILKQAEELCVPGFMTPLWRATYCRPKAESR